MNLPRFVIILAFVQLLLSACSSVPVTQPIKEPAVEEKALKQLEKAPSSISIIAVGDMMLGTDFPRNHLPPDDGKGLLQHVSTILADADITFGNLEGTLLDGGEPAKKCSNLSRCYVFRSPTHYAQNLVDAGFDVMSLANNHARDFGEHGRESSMSTLTRYGIHHSGKTGSVASWTVKGLKVAMIAFAPFRGANDPLDLDGASLSVMELATTHDIVLVSMHMGAEGADVTRIPFTTETFHGENRGDVVAFARAVIRAGADMVIGHGPHVPRALELYEGRLIAYSLGNFCTYYGINVRGLNGLAPVLKAKLAPNGSFLSGEIISTRQYRPNGPLPDPSNQAAKLMSELTRLDFPETALEINQQGQITVKSTK